MKTKKRALLIFILLNLISLQCIRDFSTDAGFKEPRQLTVLEKKLVTSDNAFGWELFKQIVAQSNNENVFISPLSVSMALGMTFNGAAGSTETAIKNVLQFTGLSKTEINESYLSLITLLSGLDDRVQFQIANSIWYRLGFKIEQNFIDLNRNYFNAEVRGLDFNSPDAPNTINAWVDEKTYGKIDKVIDKINPLTMMYLINAIYFKGVWLYEFDKSKTRDDRFNLPDGSQTDCKMMQQGGKFPYFSTAQFQAVDLPYGGDKFRMSVFLPNPGVNSDELISEIDSQTWDNWTARFEFRNGSVLLPKFEMKYKISLNKILSAMGMEVAFSPNQADFTNIEKNGDLYISNVLHKTYVAVDEEGTEAAAVTVVEMGVTSVGGPSGFYMRVDRPFLFVIWENNSNTILFIGKIVQPES
ncbi:MAG TPA: serpin family protein [Bacteroidetes bacterium]|nr:serpin family protein [Bacteroidota bacterium]